ncbi:MAG: ABC transporter substrate-binding protein [Deltaproteobacteria bacterium]|nr:ABC transporter substrate-binding protein [Deltaproteobacteria bacterium]
MKNTLYLLTAFINVILLFMPASIQASNSDDIAIQKTIKSLIGSIRYGKDTSAAKKISFADMAHELLQDDFNKFTANEQKEIISGLETIIKAISFAKGREMFKYLDAMLFTPAKIEAEHARIKSTVVIHRNLKKTEIVLEWVLVKQKGSWKVIDTIMLGESTLKGLRDEQVKPLLEQGGTQAVLKALRDKVAEVSQKEK